jgi:hypothetical protein
MRSTNPETPNLKPETLAQRRARLTPKPQTLNPKPLRSDALNAVPVFGRKILESEGPESQELGLGGQLTDCLKALLRALKEYVEKYHAAGLTWAPEPKRSANGGAGAAPAAMSTDTEKTGCACVRACLGWRTGEVRHVGSRDRRGKSRRGQAGMLKGVIQMAAPQAPAR